jgi:SARP family transcriptional regulator, regulator of embCAB operon
MTCKSIDLAEEFLVLGPLEVLRDGVPLPVRQRRVERCLLGLLLLETGRLVPKDRLIDLLRDGDPPEVG